MNIFTRIWHLSGAFLDNDVISHFTQFGWNSSRNKSQPARSWLILTIWTRRNILVTHTFLDLLPVSLQVPGARCQEPGQGKFDFKTRYKEWVRWKEHTKWSICYVKAYIWKWIFCLPGMILELMTSQISIKKIGINVITPLKITLGKRKYTH